MSSAETQGLRLMIGGSLMKRAKTALLLTGLLVAVIGVSGCQNLAEKAIEKATEKAIEGQTGNQVDIKDGSVSIQGEDGSTANIGEGAEVPAEFPKDVPVYDGTVLGAFSSADSWTLNIETTDDPKKVIEFYVARLAKDGWVKESQADMGTGGMYSAKKDGSRTVTVVAAKGDSANDKTSVTVSVNLEK
jgi:hypothetical protein